VHEGGIATPLIVRWPHGIAAHGDLRHTPGHLIDVVPTILEVITGSATTGIADAPPAPGKSLAPAFAEDVSIPRDFLWWQHEGNRALRVGDLKIVAAGVASPWELYDLKTDRSESNNLAAQQPEVRLSMEEIWKRQEEAVRELARKNVPAAGVEKGKQP
jgi:arylsulfatase